MPFATLPEILGPCVGQPWAVGAFDVVNLELTQAALDSAQTEKSPIIVMILPSLVAEQDMPALVAAVRAHAECVDVPVALHLDHAVNFRQIIHGIRLGFSAVMFDGSHLPLDENIAHTRRVVEVAHPSGVSVEAELGHVGGGDESGSADFGETVFTRLDEAHRFVAETGIDALAVSIGTAHGPYRARPKLDFDRLKELRENLEVPLVLHGGSGVPDEDTRRAIEVGIDKINVWTDVVVAYMDAVKRQLSDPEGSCRLHPMLAAGRAAAGQVVRDKMNLFGSAHRAG
jgi:fructose-bisphosphate aldolase class II